MAGQSPEYRCPPSCLELVGEGLAKLQGSRTGAPAAVCWCGAVVGVNWQERSDACIPGIFFPMVPSSAIPV